MRYLTKRRWLVVLLGLVVAFAVVVFGVVFSGVFGKWRDPSAVPTPVRDERVLDVRVDDER